MEKEMNPRMPPLATINVEAVARDEGEELLELGPGETSLTFLQRVYRSVRQPMSRRLRAAIEALPHEHPRLGAITTAQMNGNDFASMLEKAIERSGRPQAICQIEATCEEVAMPPRLESPAVKRRAIP
jgi:hypothetical protein